MDVRAGSIHQNLCGWGLGILFGFQSFPGESNEQPESRSPDVAPWFSNPENHQGRGLVKCLAGPMPRVSDSVGIRPENFHF